MKIKIELLPPEKLPYEGKATLKQKNLLWKLGVHDEDFLDDLGKEQASWCIQEINAKAEKSGCTQLFLITGGIAAFLWAVASPFCKSIEKSEAKKSSTPTTIKSADNPKPATITQPGKNQPVPPVVLPGTTYVRAGDGGWDLRDLKTGATIGHVKNSGSR